jgi:hypothetical protein
MVSTPLSISRESYLKARFTYSASTIGPWGGEGTCYNGLVPVGQLHHHNVASTPQDSTLTMMRHRSNHHQGARNRYALARPKPQRV